MTPRRLFIAAATAVAIYAALMLAWILVGGVWSRSVAFACDVLLASPGWGSHARFSIVEAPTGPALELRLTHPNHAEEAAVSLAVRPRTYMPSAMTLALVFATPISWRRRALAAALAATLILLFILLQGWMTALDAIARWPANGLGFPDSLRAAAHITYIYICEVPTIAVLVPILIWAATTLRRMHIGDP